MRLRNVSAVLLAFLLLGGVIWAQEITGSIAGAVKDPTGAMIAGATVTVRNTDQNVVVRTVTTDDKGAYVAMNLPIGHYSVTVEAKGFKKHIEKNIELNVNDKLTINATLQLGASNEVVEVQANPLQVELRSAETAGLVNGTQIRELSLNNRHFSQLVTLMPGVSNTGSEQFYVGINNPITGAANTLGISVNGQRTSSNNWTLDGADNVDRGSNLSLLMNPSVDAIAEFKVLRSNYNAEFGRSGAAQVNVVTRSGTSSLHGGAYEFWRNNNLNADTYANKENFRYWTPTPACETEFNGSSTATAPTPNCDTRKPYRYHNFGWTLGGPVYIPGVYNTSKEKTFFFFSQEFRRMITYAVGSQVGLPTQAELLGNMEAPVCVVFNANGTCSTAPGSTATKITNISPLAQAYINDIWSKIGTLPTDPQNRARAFSFRNVNNFREEMLKIDHVFGPRLSVYGRYAHDAIPTIEPMGLFGPNSYLPNVGTTQTNAPGWSLVGRATATFSPRTLLEVGYNFSYGAILSAPTGLMNSQNSPDVKATMPFPVSSVLQTIPSINYNGYFGTLGTHPTYQDYNRNHQVFTNLTKIMGQHSLKFGFTYYHYQKAENAAGNNIGTFYFHRYGYLAPPTGSTVYTFNGINYTDTQMREFQTWADFLMGRANQFSQSSVDLYPDIRDNQFEGYAQDEWRIRPNLTISYGMRYSNFRQPTDANGMLTNFDPTKYDPAQAPQIDPANGNILNPSTANLLNGVVPTAAALQMCQNLLKAGQVPYCWASGTTAPYGNASGSQYNKAFAPRIGISWDPFGNGKTAIRSGYAMFYDTGLFGIVEQNIFYNPPFVQSLSIGGSSSSAIPFDNPTGGLSIAASPKRADSRIDPNYHTPYNQVWNLGVQRQVTPSLLVDVSYVGNRANHLLGIMDINQPQVGQYLNYPILGNAQNILGATANCTNLAAARTGDTSSCSTNFATLNYIRPYQGWGAIQAIRTYAMSNYNSLQASVDKRFKGASQVGLSYTWSHALTDNQTDRSTAPQNTYNPHADYGPTQQDRRHIFTANFVYDLPWLHDQKGLVGKVLGGWELSGITTAQTGTPSTVTDSYTAWDFAGQGCRLSSTPCGIRPDLIGDPTQLPSTFSSNRVFGPTYNSSSWYWFNPNAFFSNNFALIGQVRPGNSGRGVVYGPGMWRQDLSLFKNIAITERVKTQLRFEAFNVFNHTNPNSISTGYAPLALSPTSKFGQIGTSDSSFLINRILQVGMKVNF